MKSLTLRSRISAVAGLSLAVVLAGCDSSPTGRVPYRTMQRTVAGNYRAAELFTLPPSIATTSDGKEIRLSLGTRATFSGKIIVPTAGVDIRLSGDWRVENQQVILDFDTAVAGLPPTLVLQIAFLGDRVGLTGLADVNGTSLALDLLKPLPPGDDPEGGGPFRPPPS